MLIEIAMVVVILSNGLKISNLCKSYERWSVKYSDWSDCYENLSSNFTDKRRFLQPTTTATVRSV